MKVGYVRVSTREQNTARQDELMKKLEVEKVYADKVSGKDTERTELRKMMDFVREGDTLTVSAPVRFCNFSPDWECQKKAGKGARPLNNYTCRFRPSSLKCTDKSGLNRLQADE